MSRLTPMWSGMTASGMASNGVPVGGGRRRRAGGRQVRQRETRHQVVALQSLTNQRNSARLVPFGERLNDFPSAGAVPWSLDAALYSFWDC